ncbi:MULTISPECIES: endolytic transglycosylase MltG [unclassified Mycolicibacterium]|uniref:endolytic transglycosylase MltG n=1 Tax=unclassified Mycolicibacterium TaxID=2636767 RepID=UPI0012DFADCA|nr:MULTISPECIES: endolytic transglycosylase MltG [unclassified Mycolicibacterium]MUL84413.1 aminodeoxychorismate lyase [Mycolicibacterium sp. CBMA 329]MUL88188.1 aminodeoxychorismate lyase [Mycolicibacterium sp. CBMA 331]MUL99363.1 aminodeoxychorismate lyase [Mycolicibacterium sp. CBMA 334]MUM39835.1 aminodeoxychorismate lyase [Mycolicibacterium sp. CBMA 247]MUM44253.1 aminodeoxychorismate lyase [Mycolicibacterium sp. CBMA 294]
MAEKWGVDKAEPESVGPPRRGLSRAQRARKSRNDRKRRATRGLSLTALIVVVIGAVFLGSKLWHGMSGSANDYAGDGVADVVIQVHDGDSTTAIAKTLQDHKVVATVKAFVDAAHQNEAISAIQPGFYKLRTEIPAANAVERLADPDNRVGKLTIPEGRQLDDTADVKTNAVTEGIFTMISEASCVELDGNKRCVPVEELRTAAQTAPAAALAVPDWASGPVAAMPNDHRRLEGLIAPGTWNVDPAASAQDILSTLIAGSTTVYTQGGLLDTAAAMQLSPYQILTVGSLVQREAKPQDFDKVARVIYNRLAEHRKLEFDSTVNYPLDRQEVATTDDDRSQTTPWNTYMRQGLPQTPICAPGAEALAAAEHPAAGDWLYFVTIDLQGTTLFTRDYEQHLANIELAQHNGVLDSAR